MSRQDDIRLLAAILAGQEEEGAAAELPPERLLAFAQEEATPTPAEAAALLASPAAREELALLRRVRWLQLSAEQAGPAANDNLLQPVRRAAFSRNLEDDAQQVLELACRIATLAVERGFDEDEPYLLTLHLAQGGVAGSVAGRRVEVREDDPRRLLWLSGRTDAAGAVHAAWPHPDLRPHERQPAGGLRVVVLD